MRCQVGWGWQVSQKGGRSVRGVGGQSIDKKLLSEECFSM